jgi:hypothetical protein
MVPQRSTTIRSIMLFRRYHNLLDDVKLKIFGFTLVLFIMVKSYNVV